MIKFKSLILPFYLLLSLLHSRSLNAQVRIFDNQPNLVTASTQDIVSIATADLDNDGDLDLISASMADHKIAWFENNDSGNFSRQIIISESAKSARCVYPSDIDNDGLIDVVSASWGDNKVAWYKNLGEGSFSAEKIISTNCIGAISVYCNDIDGDSLVDVVVASRDDNSISWFKNEGIGNFGERKVLTDDALSAVYVIAEDINYDGNTDIIYSSRTNRNVVLLINSGNAVFDSIRVLDSNASGQVQIGDLDGNGFNDILIASRYSGGMAWISNDSTHRFDSIRPVHPTAESCNEVVLVDIDGNGTLDIAGVVSFNNHALWVLNNGDGTFQSQETMDGYAYGAQSISSGDYDQDGDVDFVAALNGFNNIGYFQHVDSTFHSMVQLIPIGGNKVFAKDIDLDGDLDLMSTTYNYSNVNIYINNGDGKYFEPKTLGYDGYNGTAIHSSDLDGDGLPDILISGGPKWGSQKVGWYKNLGNNEFASIRIISTSVNWAGEVYSADLDNDGDQDVLSTAPSDKQIVWFENDGSGNFSQMKVISTVADQCKSIHLNDIDGDTLIDLVYPSFGDGKLLWQKNLGGDSFSSPIVISTGNLRARCVFTGDLNKDGRVDIILGYNNSIAWFKNIGNGVFESGRIITSEAKDVIELFACDLDSDGYPDIISASQGDSKVSWYKNLLNDSFSAQQVITKSAYSVMSVVAADLDGDGDFDVVSGSNTGNKIEWYENHKGDPTLSGVVYFDMNQNGKFDIGERGLPSARTLLAPTSIAHFTNDQGKYTYFIERGSYVLSVDTLAMPRWIVTNDSSFVNLAITDSTAEKNINFGVHPVDSVVDAEIAIVSGFIRCNQMVEFVASIKNTGTTILNGTLLFKSDSFIQNSRFTILPDTIIGPDLFGWNISDLFPGEYNTFKFKLEIPGVDDGFTIGDALKFGLSLVTLNLDTFSKEYEPIVRCAFDPNDKLVYPSKVIGPNYTQMGSRLTYTIRFQNTGNDTAFNVLILDTLQSFLDDKTFTLLSTSHEDNLSIEMEGPIVKFRFENIMLPDSTTDFDDSQGFVTFSINHSQDLQDSTIVSNNAAIVFDLNPAIQTNMVNNILVNPGTGGVNQTKMFSRILIYPNPANNFVTINFSNSDVEPIKISVVDGIGRTMITQEEVSVGTTLLKTSSLVPGIYWIHISTDDGILTKLILIQ